VIVHVPVSVKPEPAIVTKVPASAPVGAYPLKPKGVLKLTVL